MLCEWGTFTGREPPVHRTKQIVFCLFSFVVLINFFKMYFLFNLYFLKGHKLYAVQRSKREPPKAAVQSLYTEPSLGDVVMACGAVLAARDVHSKFTLCWDIVRPCTQTRASQMSCLRRMVCNILTHLIVSKLQGLPPTYNDAPMPGKSAGNLAMF